jgi:Zn-dependent protease/CBS domain-containing protein
MDPQPSHSARTESAAAPGALGRLRVLGVPVRFHFTLLLLLVFVLFVGIGEDQPPLMNLADAGAMLVSLLLHELGHGLVCRWRRIRVAENVVFPIGGVARLERPAEPREELWMSVAGPAASLLAAGALIGWLTYWNALGPVPSSAGPTPVALLQRLAVMNLLLGGVNLLPAFPMDGGRILRSLVALRRPYHEATRIAAATGQWLAIALGLYGMLSTHFLLLFMALFVYLGAVQESAAATGLHLTKGVPVRSAMVTDFRTLSHGDTIRDAANLLLATTQQDFPVLHAGRVVGLLTRVALLKALAAQGPDAYVASAMDRDFLRLVPGEDLSRLLPGALRSGACALVMDGDELLGLLTAENLTEFVLLRKFGMEPDRPLPPPVA